MFSVAKQEFFNYLFFVRSDMQKNLQSFGGMWTEKKLKILRDYLEAYTTALKERKFSLLYIDAFAGTGYVEQKSNPADSQQLGLLIEEEQEFLQGSVSIALKISRPFDKYLFIEEDSKKYESLLKTIEKYPQLNKRIQCEQGEANSFLQKYCKHISPYFRVVLFLDPFGMNVEWKTLEAIARTKNIDVWILFPLGIGANRLLTKKQKDMPDTWEEILNKIFGTDEWKQFYSEPAEDLFDLPNDEKIKNVNLQAIADFYQKRLRTIFVDVAPNPRMMYNSKGNPLYLFCFAMSNPSEKARKLALKIANGILKKHGI